MATFIRVSVRCNGCGEEVTAPGKRESQAEQLALRLGWAIYYTGRVARHFCPSCR